MSRLQRHRKKQLTRTIIFFSILFVLVLVFIATYGIKLLLNTSIFVADIARPKNEVTKNNNDNTFIGSINVDEIPVATNSAKFIIKGNAGKNELNH